MHEKKDTTRYQKKIKTQLRLFTWLFLLFYICYAVLQVMLLKELFPIRFQELQKRYMIRLLMEGILWLFIIRSLQKGRKIARLLFTLCAILSLYFLSAQHFLHRYTFYLVMILLGTLIGFLLFLFIMQLSFPTDIDGLQYVQRFFLLAILFTSFGLKKYGFGLSK
jgi:uncharacterized membrane protein